jgi:uroporphyrinogen decarboxylase
MTSVERMKRTLKHLETDRIPLFDSFWGETLAAWKFESGYSDADEIGARYKFDMLTAGWINHVARLGPEEITEETDKWFTRVDGNGAVLRYWKHKSGTPEHVRFTVDDHDKWELLKVDLLAVPVEKRVSLEDTLNSQHYARSRNKWFGWGGIECFEAAKDVIGHEQLCCAMAEDPEWAVDIFDTQTTVALSVMNYLEENGVRFDGALMYGDIAYNKGPFCSPRMYRKMVMPSHARQIGWFKERDLPVIYHTDGDFHALIPSFIEVGISCFQPLEAKANMDVRDLKPEYGDLVCFMGNIDAMVLNTNNLDLVEAEVASKIPAAKIGGGYIYHSDHSIPPGVKWSTYQFLMDRVAHYGRFES